MPLTLLYFGSFNPVHKGHIAIAEAAIDQHIADEVWFVLSPRNPFKQAENLWDESERAARLQKALQPHPGFKFCDAELHLPKPSYTIQTLDFLQKEHPGKSFGILMGEDNLEKLHLWREYRKILSLCPVWVYPRNGNAQTAVQPIPGPENHPKANARNGTALPGSWSRYPAVQEFPGQIHRLECPLLDISSTRIRTMLERGEDVSDLVP